ncbi:MAG: hypothetical protein AMXMBFR74_01490 [Parvibaculum sp.]
MNIFDFVHCFSFRRLLHPACQRATPEKSPLTGIRRRAMTYLNSKLTNRVITLAIAGYTLAFAAQIAAQYAA